MAVQNIDFLPVSYRLKRQRRKRSIWRRAVLAVFLLLIVAGGVAQNRNRARLETTQRQLKANAERMAAQLEDPAVLQQSIARLQAQANLVSYLKIRVPPTRVLAAITNCRPDFVTINEFDLKQELIPVTSGPAVRQAPALSPATPPAPKLPEEKDLEALKKISQESMLQVSLTGVAPHDIAIAEYLSALQKTGLFSEVKLLYTDQHLQDEFPMRRFGMRMRVIKPGGELLSKGPLTASSK